MYIFVFFLNYIYFANVDAKFQSNVDAKFHEKFKLFENVHLIELK